MSHSDNFMAREEWHDTMRNVARLISSQQLADALQILDQFLPRATDSELRANVLGMRGSIKTDLGDFEGAKEDLLSANLLVRAGFAKYVNECEIAEICRKQQKMPEVSSWYRSALRTSVAAGISGGAALGKFLELDGVGRMSEDDLKLCMNVITTSWKFLELPGDPDPEDLPGMATILKNKERGVPA